MRPPNWRPDRTPEHLKWTRVKIECGKSLKGWLAGPVFGCEGHGTPAFKPCHSLFTAGRQSCPWCAIPQFRTVKYQGYLPMYDERQMHRRLRQSGRDHAMRYAADPTPD